MQATHSSVKYGYSICARPYSMFAQWVKSKRKRDNGVKKVKAFANSNLSAGSVITNTSRVTKNATGPS
jgi:hypothetical protein